MGLMPGAFDLCRAQVPVNKKMPKIEQPNFHDQIAQKRTPFTLPIALPHF